MHKVKNGSTMSHV